MQPKKVPMRMCVGCRQMLPKKELLRVVRSADGVVSVDLKGKASGRGAYVCKSTECLDRAVKSRALDRALEQRITEEIHNKLREEMS